MRRRRALTTVLFLFALLVAACGGPTATPTPAAETPVAVRLAMGFIPNIQFAPYYVADARGYFAAEGLEVSFETMFEDDSVPLVGSGDMEFANASPEAVVQARSQGLPVVYVMKWYERYPIAIISKAETGVEKPTDLAGHKVGIPGLYGASYVGWRALLASQGIAEDAVSLEAIEFTQVPSLTEGKVDVVVGYANNEPVQLRALGYEVDVIYVADYANLASNGLIASEAMIREQPDLVQGMVRATMRGLADVIADPDAAYAISLDYVEGLAEADEATQKSVLDASIAMWRTDQPGISDRAAWASTQDILLQMGLITEPIGIDQAFTNEFVQP